MKKLSWLAIFLVVLGLMGPLQRVSFALPNNIRILNPDEIKQVSDEDLKKDYIDVLIELEVETVFYGRAGFSPKDLEQYRGLVRYRVNLLLEMQQRNLEIPKIYSY